MKRRRYLAMGTCYVLLATISAAVPGEGLTDDEIRQLIVQRSLASYSGNCPCPYNFDRIGHRCGGRSAWSRPGGRTPICFSNEVSDAQVAAFRRRGGD